MHFRRCAVVVTIEATTFRGGVMAIEVFWGSGSPVAWRVLLDRKSTRLNSSHSQISYAVFCLKKKKRSIDSDLCILYAVLQSACFEPSLSGLYQLVEAPRDARACDHLELMSPLNLHELVVGV